MDFSIPDQEVRKFFARGEAAVVEFFGGVTAQVEGIIGSIVEK